MKSPTQQSFGVARAVKEHRDYSEGHIRVEAFKTALSKSNPEDTRDMETLRFFGAEVMRFVHHERGIAITANFAGWPDSSALRSLINSMLMRLGVNRRVGFFHGAPHIYRFKDDAVTPISKVSPCEWFHVWNPGEVE